MKKFYCQPDGGMWNIPCYTYAPFTFGGAIYHVIANGELREPMLVREETLFDDPQDANIVRLK